MKSEGIEYNSGWYGQEQDDLGPFRWMKQEAAFSLKDIKIPGKKFLHLIAGHTFPDKESPTLHISINGHPASKRKIGHEFRPYLIAFEETGDIRVELKLDSVFKIPEDARDLGIIVRNIEWISSEEQNIVFGEGWYDWEEEKSFRWMSQRAQILVSSRLLNDNRYLSFSASSEHENLSQVLEIKIDGQSMAEIPMIRNWNDYHCSLVSDEEEKSAGIKKESVVEIVFSLNKLIPDQIRKGDPRELGIKIRNLSLHNEKKAYQDFLYFHKNACLNFEEMTEGKVKLESFPLYLGIDLYGKCNIKPPCVYCEWDWLKKAEGNNTNAVVDEKTLESYGPFFRSARNLVNCSIGEPLIHPRLKQILDFCEQHKKRLEMATNAQALTEDVIGHLVGKRIDLYVSLDASCRDIFKTPERQVGSGRKEFDIPEQSAQKSRQTSFGPHDFYAHEGQPG
jgi:hypothetical protein